MSTALASHGIVRALAAALCAFSVASADNNMDIAPPTVTLEPAATVSRRFLREYTRYVIYQFAGYLEYLTARDLSFMFALAYNDFQHSQSTALLLQVQFMQKKGDVL